MKTRFSALLGFASSLVLAACFGLPRAGAQTPAELKLQIYAGLTITGQAGTVYSIEYLSDLAQSNAPAAWHCLEFLQLPASSYLWADKSSPSTKKRFYRSVLFAAPTNMVFIPPGSFRMGSPPDELDRDRWENPVTRVTISQGFWIGKYEVTQGEYETVIGSNPSWFNGDRTPEWGQNYGVDLNRPIEYVSWFEANDYCARLTERDRSAGRIAANVVYRLPTEAEWEYACRAWTATRFSHGDDPSYTNLRNFAWYPENSGGMTHPVGRKLPNPWGLYDMHGNVYEWCLDWFGDYLGGTALDPQGPDSGNLRVFRGGGCGDIDDGRYCRSADRMGDGGYKGVRNGQIGFRIVLAPNRP